MTNAAINMDHHWLPFTNNKLFHHEPQIFAKAEGVRYWTPEGAEILDVASGLFCCPAGHGRRKIADAVHAQLTELDYSPHFQRAAPISFKLAERLSGILPEGIDRVFFGSSGSEAVDSAMKIAIAYHHAKGDAQRTRFVSRSWAYHGVNLGGTSLAGMVGNRREYSGITCDVVHMRHTWNEDQHFTKGQPETGVELTEDLAELCKTYGGETIAAVFVEPIAGSIGTIVPPCRILEAASRDRGPAQHSADFRRGHHRLRSHQLGFCLAEIRRHARYHHHVQGAYQRCRADECGRREDGNPADRSRCNHRRPAGTDARLHLTPRIRSPAPPHWPRSTSMRRMGCLRVPRPCRRHFSMASSACATCRKLQTFTATG